MGFFVVYIQEAHPVDLWQVSSNVDDGVLFESPQTAGERANPAGICVVKWRSKCPRSSTASTIASSAITRVGRIASTSSAPTGGFDTRARRARSDSPPPISSEASGRSCDPQAASRACAARRRRTVALSSGAPVTASQRPLSCRWPCRFSLRPFQPDPFPDTHWSRGRPLTEQRR